MRVGLVEGRGRGTVQARGRAVDKRADVWAFGVVLYEMPTGTRVFAGETVSDVLAAVLTREPDWSALPPARRAAAHVKAPPRRQLDPASLREVSSVSDAA